MKSLLTFVLLVLIFSFSYADDDKYTKAMRKNISEIDSAQTVEKLINTANKFERIALAEKDKWLPYYYASFLYTLASFSDTLNEKKDGYLDYADKFAAAADSLEQNNSEIYTLKGMIAQARMQIDPMNRWMKYGSAADNAFKKAIELNPINPRPHYLVGVGLYYTPEQFGGGKAVAKPHLEKSLQSFKEYMPENDLLPNWGKNMVEELLKGIE